MFKKRTVKPGSTAAFLTFGILIRPVHVLGPNDECLQVAAPTISRNQRFASRFARSIRVNRSKPAIFNMSFRSWSDGTVDFVRRHVKESLDSARLSAL